MTLTPKLREELELLYAKAVIRPEWKSRVIAVAERIVANKARYTAVGKFPSTSGSYEVPWWWTGAVHNLESSFSFSRHLHNGDPLTARTKQVPAGRPASGNPPFTWAESAHDALRLKKLHLVATRDWTLGRALYEWERYNGPGYRLYHPNVLSPYLWSGTTLYTRGKYYADRKWSDTLASEQVGAAPVLMMLVAMGEVRLCK